MIQVKRLLKILFGNALKRTFFSTPSVKKANIILMYHRVLPTFPDGFSEPGLIVKASTLEMHLEQVRRVYDLVPLTTFLQLKNKKNGLCAITFDDGWIDTYEVAFPILKKFKLPATVFVPTGLVGRSCCFWFDNLTTLANLSIKKNKQEQFLQTFVQWIPGWKPGRLTNRTVCNLISCMKLLPSNILDEIVSSAYAALGIEKENSRTILGWEHIVEMGKFNISFGSHGLKHFILTTVNSEMKMDEVCKSIQVLLERDINTAPLFSYPNGNWDEESLRLVEKAGYEGAVTTRLGYNDQSTNPYLMNRIDMHEFSSNTPSLLWFRLFQAVIAKLRKMS